MDMSRQYGSYDAMKAAETPEAVAADQRRRQQEAQQGGPMDWLFGNQNNPGVLGTGYRQPGQVSVDPNSANIPNYDQNRRRSLAAALAAQGRGGPTTDYARINMGPQAQFRQGQMGLVNALTAQANGQGPSLAQGQLQQATDRNLSQAMALGQSQAGGQASGLGQRQVMQQQAGYAQQAASDSGLMRMQEQMQARNQLAQVLAGARGQDIGLATEQAGFSQGANMANLQALLAQRGMNDTQQQFFERQGVGLDLAQGGQNMTLAQLLAQMQLGSNQLGQQAYDNAAQRRMQMATMGAEAGGQAAGAAGSGLAALIPLLSDERAKTNIERLDSDAIPGVPWATWDYLSEYGGVRGFGVVAQDLEKVAPQFVTTRPDGLKVVDYSFLEARQP